MIAAGPIASSPISAGPGEGGPIAYAAGPLALAVYLNVAPPDFFVAATDLQGAVVVTVGGAVIPDDQVTGDIDIEAAEGQARVASLSLIPASADQLTAWHAKPTITIDVVLSSGGAVASGRRFTGRVSHVTFDAAQRVAHLECSDGYQERIKSCTSASEVESLFGQYACHGPAVTWSSDPIAYFGSLEKTLLGATYIDGSGVWRAVPWAISEPMATITQEEMDDGGLDLSGLDHDDLPATITTSLVVRHARLHALEIPVRWEALPRDRFVVDGIQLLPRDTVTSTLSGLDGWVIKGQPVITSPAAGTFDVLVGGQSVKYIVSEQVAAASVQSFSATMYRRWYQSVETTYTFTVATGGQGQADESVGATLTSAWDAEAWETAKRAESAVSVYTANAPATTAPKTGYEGLAEPWPVVNSAMDYRPDISDAQIAAAARAVVYMGVRRVAQALRGRKATVTKMIDPRFDVGDVLRCVGYGATVIGQIVEWRDRISLDSGEASTTITLAVPTGGGSATGATVTIPAPQAPDGHTPAQIVLSTLVGAHNDTPDNPGDDPQGFLVNAISTSPNYNAAKPAFAAQLRLTMPEIPASDRDPVTVKTELDVAWHIAGGSYQVAF